MLVIEAEARMAEERLGLAVSFRNSGAEPIWCAVRAPFGIRDLGTLYVSGTEQGGLVHFLLDEPPVPPGMRLYAPPKVFCGRLEPGAEREERFVFTVPLVEESATQPRPAEETDFLGSLPVRRFRLTVGWIFERETTAVRPVAGGPEEARFVWPGLPRKARIEGDAPGGVMLWPRADGFMRF